MCSHYYVVLTLLLHKKGCNVHDSSEDREKDRQKQSDRGRQLVNVLLGLYSLFSDVTKYHDDDDHDHDEDDVDADDDDDNDDNDDHDDHDDQDDNDDHDDDDDDENWSGEGERE